MLIQFRSILLPCRSNILNIGKYLNVNKTSVYTLKDDSIRLITNKNLHNMLNGPVSLERMHIAQFIYQEYEEHMLKNKYELKYNFQLENIDKFYYNMEIKQIMNNHGKYIN